MVPRTTLCATVGPACEGPLVLEGLIQAGVQVFRINGGFVAVDALEAWVSRIREAAAGLGREVGILLDLPGSGLRLGAIADEAGIQIHPGDRLRVDGDPAPADVGRFSLPAFHLLAEAQMGQIVFLGDGLERLEIVGRDGGALLLEVLDGGTLRAGMGFHVPGLMLSTSVPTREDRVLLERGVEAGIDLVALSFVRTHLDVARLKEALSNLGAPHVLALAKIERRESLEALDLIVDIADGVIVARGDLGIDAGFEQVPPIQRRILAACRRAAKPAVIATEMLGSMTRHPRPSRAEASDVAHAVFEGADAVMLSGETALGVDPVRVAETMARILLAAEADPDAPYAGSPLLPPPRCRPGRPDQSVVRAAVDLAREVGAKAIVAFTRHGQSASRLSKERPGARILAFAPDVDVVRRLSLAWGVEAVVLPGSRNTDDLLMRVQERVREVADLQKDDRVVVVMGGAEDPAGATTLIKLLRV